MEVIVEIHVLLIVKLFDSSHYSDAMHYFFVLKVLRIKAVFSTNFKSLIGGYRKFKGLNHFA